MSKTIRIGTRDSELALWQANTVRSGIEALGHKATLVPIKSTGDLILDKPLYELGITGIFTKALDVAMLKGEIDIAVHSMKDVPTALPAGIVQTAVLKRGSVTDVLLTRQSVDLQQQCIIATGSLRRKAQWLERYPQHTLVDLRGNVNTRLKKLKEGSWDGAIFAKAGLERIGLLPENYELLDWMVPAPAQGAMVVVALEEDRFSIEVSSQLHDKISGICTRVERDFLRTLEGGCTAPIGAYARPIGTDLEFSSVLLNPGGTKVVRLNRTAPISDHEGLGEALALEVLANGGREIMNEIKEQS